MLLQSFQVCGIQDSEDLLDTGQAKFRDNPDILATLIDMHTTALGTNYTTVYLKLETRL